MSHNSHTGRAAQDEPTQAAAAFDADAEFVFPGDMADDDGFAGGGCESEATDAGSAVDAPTPVSDGNNSSNDSGDDALIATRLAWDVTEQTMAKRVKPVRSPVSLIK